MKKFAVVALLPLVVSPLRAETFHAAPGLSDAAIRGAIHEARRKDIDPEISKLIDTMRDGGERRARIEAAQALAERYSAQSSIDRERIVDALLFATSDNDRAFRHYPIVALGRVAEEADETVATRIAQDLGQRIYDQRVRTPFEEAGERVDLLGAYARTGGRARALIGQHVDQFLSAVIDEARDSGNDREKALALRALNIYMGRSVSTLYFDKRDAFARIAADLIPLPLGADRERDIDARSEYARALVFLGARRTTVLIEDPAQRQKLHDRLEELYNNEPDPSLKYYLGLVLGHRLIQ